MPVAIPSVQGYAVTAPSSPVAIAAVQGYAVTIAISVPDFTQLFPAVFLAAVNKQFKRTFTATNLTFGVSTTLNTDQAYNTSIPATAKYGSGFAGTKTLKYTRFPLSQAFSGKTVLALPAMDTTVLKSLAAINAQYGLNFQSYDIVDAPIDSGASQLTLTIAGGSGFFIPGSTFTIGLPLPQFSTLFSDPAIRWT